MVKKQTARAVFFIGTTLAVDFEALSDSAIETAIEADTLTLVGEVENMGSLGDIFSIAEGVAIADTRVNKVKTSVRGSTQEAVLFSDIEDAGQLLMKAAKDSLFDFNFKIELADLVGGTGSTPTRYYYRGLVTRNEVQLNTIDDFVRRLMTIELNTDTVERPPIVI